MQLPIVAYDAASKLAKTTFNKFPPPQNGTFWGGGKFFGIFS